MVDRALLFDLMFARRDDDEELMRRRGAEPFTCSRWSTLPAASMTSSSTAARVSGEVAVD